MSYIRSIYGFALLVPALCVSVSSCGGATNEPGDSPGNVVSGAECASDGREAPADDGCNTCACTAGAWSCTKKACLPPGTGGVTGAGGKPATGGVAGAGGKPATGGVTGAGGSPVCMPGPSEDGCNKCTCVGGQRVCTAQTCPAPLCKEGESKFDGCNTCKCAGGQWACTRKACPPPPVDADAGSAKGCGGWLGDTCTAAEYCAYEPGQHCGAADASATCRPRPTACDAVYAPVCGCDGKTYGNGCEAAGKGTGVLGEGACQ